MKKLNYLFLLQVLLLCTINAGSAQTTFSEHIAPIIFNNCVSCHRNGEIAPFPLTTYQEVKSHAGMIASVTASRYMPPWKPAANYGSFANTRSLTEQQIQLISDWVNDGAPEGDPSKTPAVPVFPDGSQLGTPDLVLTMSETFTIKDDYKDVYRNFVLPSGLLEDKNIAAIEFRPGNSKVVHHVLMFLDTTNEARRLDSLDPEPGYSGFGGPGFDAAESLLGWVPGATPRIYPAALGLKFYKHCDVVIQIHYAPSGTVETDQSHLNIFYKKTPILRQISQYTANPKVLVSDKFFIIPANQVKGFQAVFNVPVDFSLMAVAPHMHLLGATAKSYAVTANNDTIPLISIEKWDFHWQGAYFFKNLIKIPRGSKVYYEASYDNTTNNIENPNNPPKLTTWGESTLDEMFLCYFYAVPYISGDENISFETTTGIEEEQSKNITGLQISPNPAQQYANIRFFMKASQNASVELFDQMGQKVMTILPNQRLEAGEQNIGFSSLNLSAGMYLCRLITGNTILTSSITIIP
ncbi:MAG: T9SS type A sorting domain-containing protein [Bacteroidetes bacterium]|nr:T9SS type A sorting domain-containing protein [Bacteroidota bacterium]